MKKEKIYNLINTGLNKLLILNRIRNYEFDAKKRLKGKRTLTSSQKKAIKEFWKKYPLRSYNWHDFYSNKTGRFDVRYIPDSIWFSYIDPFFNPNNEAKVLDNKIFYERLFTNKFIAHPVTIAYRHNKVFINPETYEHLSRENLLQKLDQESEIFVKKAKDSCGGRGVVHFYIPEESAKFINYIDKGSDDIIIQRKIVQHPILNRLNQSSVNTIRMLSMLRNNDLLYGSVKILSSILRIGQKGAFVDNASSGGITCGITQNGQLKDVAFNTKGEKFLEHPDSKVKFTEIIIPKYKEVCEIIKKLHLMLPQFGLLSWDIAVNSENIPILIEVNMQYGELDFHQLNNGPIFGDDTEMVLNEVFKKV